MFRKACPGLDPGWAPVRRQEHAPLKKQEACPDSAGTGRFLWRHAGKGLPTAGAVDGQVLEVGLGRWDRVGHPSERLLGQGVALGLVFPGHVDQAVRDLVVGCYQGKADTYVGLATEVFGTWHAGTPNGLSCNARALVRFL